MNHAEAATYGGILANSVAFQDLPSAALSQVLASGLMLEAKSGDPVLLENLRGSPGLYVVLEGEIEVHLSRGRRTGDKPNKPIRLATVGPGHCFGEYSLIDGQGTTAAARALTDSKLFFLPRGEFQRVVESDLLTGKIIYRNFLRLLVARLRQKNAEVDILIMQ